MDFTWLAVSNTSTALIALVFVLGFIAKQLHLAPLVGFLIAGFVLKVVGLEESALLTTLADLGITLLLFTLGLKLDIRSLIKPYIWAVSSLHIAGVIVVFGILFKLASLTAIPLVSELDTQTSILLAFALSFSSTVFAVKVLEDNGELKANHGRVAIGILIMQDIFAVAFLTVSAGKLPSPWALAVVIALIALRPVFIQIIKRVGHGELLVIAGFIFALGGASLFEMVDMKADLGALIMGVILGRHDRASEMSSSLLAFKDLFLIGFFLNIGLHATLSVDVIIIASMLVVLLPLKVILYFWLMSLFRLRTRTAFLTSLSLTNYSEFGLIVSAIGFSYGWISSEWLGVVAVALAFTFILASPLNIASHRLFKKYDNKLPRFEHEKVLQAEETIDAGDAEILIFGMGRVGTAAFETMRKQYGDVVLGIDHDESVINKHRSLGRNVMQGDAEDSEFWQKLNTKNIHLILLDMPKPEENLYAFRQLEEHGFRGKVAATVKYDDQVEMLKKAGLDAAYNIYGEAGAGFANHVSEQLCQNIEFSTK